MPPEVDHHVHRRCGFPGERVRVGVDKPSQGGLAARAARRAARDRANPIAAPQDGNSVVAISR